jgi:hypothetical protein
MELWW